MRQMLEAGVHFGHQVRYWNPKMAPYIFGVRQKIHIINLEKTLPLYKQAVNFLSNVAAKKGRILFVGTKASTRDIVAEAAKRCGMPYVNYRWLGGMLTNYKTIRLSIKRLKELEEMRDSAVFANLSKKEALTIMREITKLERNLGGIRDMGGLPEVVFVLDVGHEKIAVSEASKLKIPLVGIVDTNHDPVGINYPIPGNDDSIKAIQLYLQGIVDAVVEARKNIVEEQSAAERSEQKPTKKTAGAKKKVVTKKTAVAKKADTNLSDKAEVNTKAKIVVEKSVPETEGSLSVTSDEPALENFDLDEETDVDVEKSKPTKVIKKHTKTVSVIKKKKA